MIWWELPKSLMHSLVMVQTNVHSSLFLGRSSAARVSHIIRLGGELVSPTLMMQSILKISFTLLLFLPCACHSFKRWGTGFTNWFFISSLSFHKSMKARFCKNPKYVKDLSKDTPKDHEHIIDPKIDTAGAWNRIRPKCSSGSKCNEYAIGREEGASWWSEMRIDEGMASFRGNGRPKEWITCKCGVRSFFF